MTTQLKAEALALAVLEGEDPKDFIQRLLPDIEQQKGIKRIADYNLEDIGIDHCQYFTGRGTAHSDWDAVYVGAGDNPAESIADAIDQAASDGWITEPLDTSSFGETPSVSDEITDQATQEAKSQIKEEDYESLEDYTADLDILVDEIIEEGEWELYYYTALYLRSTQSQSQEQVTEAEDPKEFLRMMSKGQSLPTTWPQFKRWSSKRWDADYRRAYYTHKRHTVQFDQNGGLLRNPDGTLAYKPYEKRVGLKASKFWRNKHTGQHGLRYHNTNVLVWNKDGSITTDTGGYLTRTTRERINTFLPHGWRVIQYQNNWYWYNHEWPENVRDRLLSDQSARRIPAFPWWIPFSRGDTIQPDGTLIFGNSQNIAEKQGLAKPDGAIKLAAWNEMRPAPEGILSPPRRGRGNANEPNQPLFWQEGRYMHRLARWKRIKAKHERIRQVEKQKRDLEKVDEPEKKKPKKGHQHPQ